MDRFALLFSLTFLLSTSASAEDKNIWSRFFKIIPEKDAHVTNGMALSREFNPHSIKVFIWNIKKAELGNWKNEFESYGKNQDLILIQEAYQNERFNTTTANFDGIRWDMGISFIYLQDNNTATGTMIGSKVEPIDVFVKHTRDVEPIINTPKAMTFARYQIENKNEELLVITVHGINLTDFSAFERHMAQAESEIENHHGPILFAGDFNTRTKERTGHLMRLIEKHGLKPVTFKNGHQRMTWKFTKNYLDHSFVRGLSVKDAVVKGDSIGSDHKPMIMEISVD